VLHAHYLCLPRREQSKSLCESHALKAPEAELSDSAGTVIFNRALSEAALTSHSILAKGRIRAPKLTTRG